MRRPLANLCTTLLLALSATAAAAQSSVDVVDVPDGCGSERELYEGLEELVGQDANAALPARLRISAADADGMHTLSLQIKGESRVLEDRDCRALWKSAIVMCAVRVRPDLTLATGTAPAPSSAGKRAESDESAPWYASVGIGGGAVLGLGPALAPVFELNASLESDRFGAALALRATTATEARTDDARGARVHAFGARLAALAVPWPIARFQAGVELHRLSGEGFGSEATLSDAAWAFAPMLEAALRPLRLSHLWLEIGVAGSLNVVRPRFDIVGYATVYRVPQFGGSAVLRLGWAFR